MLCTADIDWVMAGIAWLDSFVSRLRPFFRLADLVYSAHNLFFDLLFL
jgi:hypothetical protein